MPEDRDDAAVADYFYGVCHHQYSTDKWGVCKQKNILAGISLGLMRF